MGRAKGRAANWATAQKITRKFHFIIANVLVVGKTCILKQKIMPNVVIY